MSYLFLLAENLKAADLAPNQLKKEINDFIIESLMTKSRGLEMSSSNLGICVFCQTKQANVTFKPCGHLALCSRCFSQNQSQIKFCPCCRKTIKSYEENF